MLFLNWQAIIFDFDGVIVESGDIKTQAFGELYRSYGPEIEAAVMEYHKQNGGMSRYRKFHYFQEQLLHQPPLTPQEEQDLDQRFSELVIEAVINSESVPGAEALIHNAYKHIPLFIASGTPEKELQRIVEQRGLASYFIDVRGSPQTKQALIAEILGAHALTPEKVLMVGDAMADYLGAKANNTAFLGRVRPGDTNPFPADVKVVSDLHPLLTC